LQKSVFKLCKHNENWLAIQTVSDLRFNKNEVIFVLLFQAVTFSLMSDFEGAFSLFKKLSTISKIVLEKAQRLQDSGKSMLTLGSVS
jgi:hypothetical protein